MNECNFKIGDKIIASPVGPGVITSITPRGFPKVDDVAVAWLCREDGAIFNPHELTLPSLSSIQYWTKKS